MKTQNTIKTIIIALLFIVVFSCSDNKDCCSPGHDIGNRFSLVDDMGNDLLNPDTPGYYDPETIRIYHLIDGEKVLQYNPMSDTPYAFDIYAPEDTFKEKYSIRVTQSLDISEEISVVYVEWNETETDTIEYQRELIYDNMLRLINIWYNTELVWSEEGGGNPDDRYFEIIK